MKFDEGLCQELIERYGLLGKAAERVLAFYVEALKDISNKEAMEGAAAANIQAFAETVSKLQGLFKEEIEQLAKDLEAIVEQIRKDDTYTEEM